MPIPKSKTLPQHEGRDTPRDILPFEKPISDKTIVIKPVKMHNNYVAILQTASESPIQLANTEGQYKNEGLVIGVGPGLSDNNGGRLKPTVNVGDYVMIAVKNHVATIVPDNGHYQGRKVVIISENHIVCDIPCGIPYVIESE